MRNRAKCKICESVIESYGTFDFVKCKCGEIYVDGGEFLMKCGANDFSNFIRVDDEGKEITPTLIEIGKASGQEKTREEKIEFVDAMLRYYDNMPQSALLQAVNHYDLKAIYLMIKSLL